MAMFAVNLAVFCCFYFFGFQPSTDNLPVAAMQGLGLVSTMAAALYVAMMALYYAKDSGVAGRTRKRDAPAHGDRHRAASRPPKKPNGRVRQKPNSWPR